MNRTDIQAIRVYRTKSKSENQYAGTGEYVCELFDFENEKILTVMFLNDCVDGGWEETAIDEWEIWDSISVMLTQLPKEQYEINHIEALVNGEWKDFDINDLFKMATEYIAEIDNKEE